MAKVTIPATAGIHSKSLHDLPEVTRIQVREMLLSWYSDHARVLPWRIPPVSFKGNSYPEYVNRLYRCLISETMLQQTQVKTVIAYYTKWLVTFPTLQDLADAQEEKVMACWAGLGYYSRAKRLQQAAQFLMKDVVSKEVEFPREPEYWIKQVPGVGPYTAGAIISISFNIPSAIVDGNVQRVLSRVLAIHGDTSTPKSGGSKLIWARAGQLVDGKEPGNLNQSLMELGATICTPTLPACSKCPISIYCTAFQTYKNLKPKVSNFFALKSTKKAAVSESKLGQPMDIEDLCTICPATIDPSEVPAVESTYIQSLYPFKPAKKVARQESAIVYVIRKGNLLYLEKKAKGLLAGLFDFPTLVLSSEDDVETLLTEQGKELAAKSEGSTLHLFTHIKRVSNILTCDSHNASQRLAALIKANDTGRWVEQDKLGDLGVSELCLKNWRLATGVDAPKKRKAVSNSKPTILRARKKLAAIKDESGSDWEES